MPNLISIPSTLIEHSLYAHLWKMRAGGEDKEVWNLISRVCQTIVYKREKDSRDREYIGEVKLSEEDKALVAEYGLMEHDNPEIRARFCDVMAQYAGKERRNLRQAASNAYLKVYEMGRWPEFLIRSVELRIDYDRKYLDRILEQSKVTYPSWLSIIGKTLLKRNVKDLDEAYLSPLIEYFEENGDKKDIGWNEQYLQFLLDVKKIDRREFHYRNAMFFEVVGDDGVERQRKEPTTFFMDIHQNFEKAFRHIDNVKVDYPEECKRIRAKYESEKKRFVEMMSLCGVKIEYKVDERFIKEYVDPIIANLKLKDPLELILYYAGATNFLASKMPEKKEHSFLNEHFGQNVRMDDDGNDVGDCGPEVNYRVQMHTLVRQYQLYLLRSMLEYKVFLQLEFDDKDVYELLVHCRPEFIDEGKVVMWAKGISYGFSGKYVESVYILMPMLEDGLRGLAAQLKGESLTLLNKQRQTQPSLERTLSELKPYLNEELHFELESFLVKGYDVNFRNELLHGLMRPQEAYRFAPYLLYLCVRLYFFPEGFREING